jgi:hypothetical protein
MITPKRKISHFWEKIHLTADFFPSPPANLHLGYEGVDPPMEGRSRTIPLSISRIDTNKY